MFFLRLDLDSNTDSKYSDYEDLNISDSGERKMLGIKVEKRCPQKFSTVSIFLYDSSTLNVAPSMEFDGVGQVQNFHRQQCKKKI